MNIIAHLFAIVKGIFKFLQKTFRPHPTKYNGFIKQRQIGIYRGDQASKWRSPLKAFASLLASKATANPTRGALVALRRERNPLSFESATEG
jgi:hypothetical protein